MRRPTTGNTTVFPHVEHVTPEQNAILRQLLTDTSDPDRFQTFIIAGRAYCAIALCGMPEGEGLVGVMVMVSPSIPDHYFAEESYRRAAQAIGVAEITEGPRWEVRRFADPVREAAKATRNRVAEVHALISELNAELRLLMSECQHVNQKHHQRGTAEDDPWDECLDCGKAW